MNYARQPRVVAILVTAGLASLSFASVRAASFLGAPDLLTPPQIMARYAAALAKAKTPKAVTFDYSLEQLGLRNMEQTHHVFRSYLDERDETRMIDGYELPRPTVRIIANRVYRYDLHALAPRSGAYTFAYAGTRLDGDDIMYLFRTTPVGARAFAISDIVLDGRSFLPRLLRFKVATPNAHGSGQIAYGRADKYWVVSDAKVSAHLAQGALATEHIHWTNYQFPPSLPPSTFRPPRTLLAPLPEGTVTPLPAVAPGAP